MLVPMRCGRSSARRVMRKQGHARPRALARNVRNQSARDTLFVVVPRDCSGTCDESSDGLGLGLGHRHRHGLGLGGPKMRRKQFSAAGSHRGRADCHMLRLCLPQRLEPLSVHIALMAPLVRARWAKSIARSMLA